jgi:peptide/nickel transport system substrate-binding protein
MRKTVAVAAVLAGVLAASGCTKAPAATGPKANVGLTEVTTASAKGDVPSLTWYGDYRAPYTLDPIKVADYPEETIIPNICPSLLRRSADYSLQPSIASAWRQVDPTTLAFTIRSGLTFSDGSPLTADDVVFSLRRNMDPANASSFAEMFASVKSIDKTAADQVTVTFSRPNVVFVQGAATIGAAVVSQAYVTAKKDAFGTPDGGVLCAGPYKVDSFDGSTKLVLSRNDHYWDAKPHAQSVTFLFPADANALANAISSGTVQGAFDVPSPLLPRLSTASNGKLYIGQEGSSPQNGDLIISDLNKGPLADVRVRQALSLAIDRKAIAQTLFGGAADPLYAVTGPGLWPASTHDIYKAAYDKLVVTPDLAKAKDLVTQAGATGKTVSIAYPAGVDVVANLATVLQQTGNSIGLSMKIVAVPPDQYGALFIDAKARGAYDSFFTLNYMEFPEPATMYSSYTTPEGFQNYGGYANATVTDLLHQAQGTPDDAARARLVVQAQDQVAKDLPWIPIVAPRATLFQGTGLTGAPISFSFFSSPWVAAVGAP